MNMAEAKKRLMELADGEYHSLEYKVSDHGKGNVSQECTVYMHGRGSFEAPHWDMAIDAMQRAVDGKPVITEDIPLSKKED